MKRNKPCENGLFRYYSKLPNKEVVTAESPRPVDKDNEVEDATNEDHEDTPSKSEASVDPEDDTDKENMGIQSQTRVPPTKKMRNSAFEHRNKVRKENSLSLYPRNQTTLDGDTVKTVDNGAFVCRTCQYELEGKVWKKGHHELCSRSECTPKDGGPRISKEEVKRRKLQKRLEKANNKKEKYSPTTQEPINNFMAPRTVAPTCVTIEPSQETPTKKPAPKDSTPVVGFVDHLSSEAICTNVKKRMEKPSKPMQKASCPPHIAALIDYVLHLLPSTFESKSNHVKANDTRSRGYKALKWYRKQFPPGTIGFTVPPSDKSKPPDPTYSLLEGTKVYVVRWELNVPGVHLGCVQPPEWDGEMIHRSFDFKQHGSITPIFDIDRPRPQSLQVASYRRLARLCAFFLVL